MNEAANFGDFTHFSFINFAGLKRKNFRSSFLSPFLSPLLSPFLSSLIFFFNFGSFFGWRPMFFLFVSMSVFRRRPALSFLFLFVLFVFVLRSGTRAFL